MLTGNGTRVPAASFTYASASGLDVPFKADCISCNFYRVSADESTYNWADPTKPLIQRGQAAAISYSPTWAAIDGSTAGFETQVTTPANDRCMIYLGLYPYVANAGEQRGNCTFMFGGGIYADALRLYGNALIAPVDIGTAYWASPPLTPDNAAQTVDATDPWMYVSNCRPGVASTLDVGDALGSLRLTGTVPTDTTASTVKIGNSGTGGHIGAFATMVYRGRTDAQLAIIRQWLWDELRASTAPSSAA